MAIYMFPFGLFVAGPENQQTSLGAGRPLANHPLQRDTRLDLSDRKYFGKYFKTFPKNSGNSCDSHVALPITNCSCVHNIFAASV